MWRYDTKCKYMFMFSLKKLARKGLKHLPHYASRYSYSSLMRLCIHGHLRAQITCAITYNLNVLFCDLAFFSTVIHAPT